VRTEDLRAPNGVARWCRSSRRGFPRTRARGESAESALKPKTLRRPDLRLDSCSPQSDGRTTGLAAEVDGRKPALLGQRARPYDRRPQLF